MSINKAYVFVYGTLRAFERYHHLLDSAIKVAEQAWTYGRLYDTHQGYPALIKDKKKRVYGEVYQISELILARLDELEGYTPGREDNLYCREWKRVYTDFGEVKAYVYLYQAKVTEQIDSGDWKVYQLMKKKEILYFAYGSCMDLDRFRVAGVADQFRHVLGCGVLQGYQLRYTRQAKDGGRADIVESKGYEVQGKVYSIKNEVLPYLFQREGVGAAYYRPAVIHVELKNRMLFNVLTFIVVDKQKEKAPPYSYVQEIIRGGYGIVSEKYLLEQINYLATKHKLDKCKLEQFLPRNDRRRGD